MLPTRAEETLYAAAQASTCMAMFQLYQATSMWVCVHFVLCPSSVGRRPTRPLSSSCPPPPCPRQRKGQSPSPRTRHTLRISANRQPILSPGVLLETHRALTYVSTRASAHPHAGASACSSEWVSVVHVVTIFVSQKNLDKKNSIKKPYCRIWIMKMLLLLMCLQGIYVFANLLNSFFENRKTNVA